MKRFGRQRASRRAGYSMLELMIGLALTATMVLAVVFTSDRTTGAYRESRARQDLEMQASRTLDRIASVFADAERAGLDPQPLAPFGAEAVDYRRCLGWDGADVVWGPESRFALELETGELDDGVDNNGNGLVDEGVVVWIREPDTPNEQRTVIAHGVSRLWPGEIENGGDDNGNGLLDERGLSFELSGNVLTIRLCLEDVDRDGRLLQNTAETSVRIRN